MIAELILYVKVYACLENTVAGVQNLSGSCRPDRPQENVSVSVLTGCVSLIFLICE